MIPMNGHKSFSLKFYLVLFLRLVSFLNAFYLSERDPSIFAKVATDITFTKMLSDTQVAEALINAFFQSMPEGTISLLIKIRDKDKGKRRRKYTHRRFIGNGEHGFSRHNGRWESHCD
jgi:hypothetical protein